MKPKPLRQADQPLKLTRVLAACDSPPMSNIAVCAMAPITWCNLRCSSMAQICRDKVMLCLATRRLSVFGIEFTGSAKLLTGMRLERAWRSQVAPLPRSALVRSLTDRDAFPLYDSNRRFMRAPGEKNISGPCAEDTNDACMYR